MKDMYKFAGRPAWLALHMVVLVITVTFVLLGRWQFQRLDDRRSENAVVAARLQAEPVAWTAGGEAPAEYGRLTLTGAFRPEEESLLRSQVNLGRPGFDVLTPLYLDEEAAIIVNRGWVPLEFDTAPVMPALPVEGEVVVEGFVRYPLAGSGPAREGNTDVMERVDLTELDQATGGDLLTFYVELTGSTPAPGDLPIAADLPELDDGPHLSYAVQWLAFAAVSVLGYAALLRATARRSSVTRRAARRPPPPS